MFSYYYKQLQPSELVCLSRCRTRSKTRNPASATCPGSLPRFPLAAVRFAAVSRRVSSHRPFSLSAILSVCVCFAASLSSPLSLAPVAAPCHYLMPSSGFVFDLFSGAFRFALHALHSCFISTGFVCILTQSQYQSPQQASCYLPSNTPQYGVHEQALVAWQSSSHQSVQSSFAAGALGLSLLWISLGPPDPSISILSPFHTFLTSASSFLRHRRDSAGEGVRPPFCCVFVSWKCPKYCMEWNSQSLYPKKWGF